jgi:opacity protein-like surface antigen
MSKYYLIMALALTLLSAASLNAQTQGGAFLGPQLGYFKAGDADNGTVMGGLSLRLKVNPALSFEGSVNYRQESYFNDGMTVRSWPVMVTGMLYPIPVVYGLIGAGWYNSSETFDQNRFPGAEDQTKQNVGWHFGGGLELPAGPNLFTVDLRYVFLNYDFTAVPGSSSINSDFYVLTIGYLFSI